MAEGLNLAKHLEKSGLQARMLVCSLTLGIYSLLLEISVSFF